MRVIVERWSYTKVVVALLESDCNLTHSATEDTTVVLIYSESIYLSLSFPAHYHNPSLRP